MISAQYTGKVGVNTNTPAKTLDVNGNFQTISALSDGITDGIETNAESMDGKGIKIYSVKGDKSNAGDLTNGQSLIQLNSQATQVLSGNQKAYSSFMLTGGYSGWDTVSTEPYYEDRITHGPGQINAVAMDNGELGQFFLTKNGFAVGSSRASATGVTSTLQSYGSFSAAIAKFQGDVTDSEFTILGNGDCTLPSPKDVTGRIYNFVYDGTDYNVLGSLRLDGSVISSYSIKGTNSVKRISVQSDGTNWVILL